MKRDTGVWHSVEYSSFSVGPESDKYRLSVSGFSGDTDDALAAPDDPAVNNNGMQFSTMDQDNDMKIDGLCQTKGWWFNNCSTSQLNSVFPGYWDASRRTRSVVFDRMLVKFDWCCPPCPTVTIKRYHLHYFVTHADGSTISKKPMQLWSTNLTEKCSTMASGNPFILGSNCEWQLPWHYIKSSPEQTVWGRVWWICYHSRPTC